MPDHVGHWHAPRPAPWFARPDASDASDPEEAVND